MEIIYVIKCSRDVRTICVIDTIIVYKKMLTQVHYGDKLVFVF